MYTYRIQLIIALVLLIGGSVFLYFFTGAFGSTTQSVTINTNPDLDNGLVGHWTFDNLDTSTGTTTDSSGSGNDAVFESGTGGGGSCGFGTDVGGGECRGYITSGSTWNVPSDWNDASNTIEAIGAGGDGAISTGSANAGGGGGGGEYRRAADVNLPEGGTVDINIPSGGDGSGADGAWMKDTDGGGGTKVIEAMNGANGSGISGGSGGTGGTGSDANYDGGTGGDTTDLNNTAGSGGGGGGSAGPSGAGKDGGTGTGSNSNGGGGGGGSNGGSSTVGSGNSGTTGGDGGAGNGGSGGGGGGTADNSDAGDGSNGGGGGGSGNAGGSIDAGGGNGGTESLWDTGVGPGGGGGGGGAGSGSSASGDRDGGTGGTYGGGGGGCGYSGVLDSGECDGTGVGGQGIIVVSYTSTGGSDALTGKIAPGKVGQAFQFDGSDDYVTASSSSSLNQLSAFTCSAWIYPTTVSGEQAIVYKEVASNGKQYCGLSGSGTGRLYVNIDRTSDATARTNDNAIKANKWQFITTVWDGTNAPQIYINGTEVSSYQTQTAGSGTIVDDSSGDLVIGGRSTPSTLFNGKLDDIRIYNRVLSPAEIKRIYELGATTHIATTINTNPNLENGLVGHWTFDGDLDSVIADSSGQGTDGYFGTSSEATSSMVVPGAIGQAIGLDGTDDFALIPSYSSIQGGQDLTIALWFNTSSDNSYQKLITKSTDGGDKDWELGVDTSQSPTTVSFESEILDSGYKVSGTSTIQVDRWYSLVATIDVTNNTLTLYVDGREVGEDVGSLVGNTDTSSSIVSIGRRNYSYPGGYVGSLYTQGKIDDIRIYDRILSPAEIKRLYELGATTHIATSINTNPDLESGLVGHYTFDGNLGTVIADSSGRGNDVYFGTTTTATSTMVTAGRMGQGVQFDGIDQYIDAGNPSDFQLTGAMTVSAWVKVDKYGTGTYQNPRFVAKGGNGGNRGWSLNGENNGQVVFNIADSATTEVVASTSPSGTGIIPGKWVHYAGVFIPSTAVQLYMNGKLVDEHTASVPATQRDSTNNVAIGKRFQCTGCFLDGSMDDVRIYNRALSADEIQRLYDLGR